MVGDFEDRLAVWHNVRLSIEDHPTPVQAAIDFWNQVKESSRNLDPYDQATWPDPWEMIEENDYCNFTKLLAVAYTFMLTKSYKDCQPIIKIALDKYSHTLYYILLINDQIVGLDNDKGMYMMQKEPKNLQVQKIHTLSSCY